MISFGIDWFDLAAQGTLESLLQHHSSKASILRFSAFFMVQLSHLYMTTVKTIALKIWTFVGKMMSLLFNMLSRFVITFLPRNKHFPYLWLIHIDVWQKPTQYCKTIILQLKIHKEKNKMVTFKKKSLKNGAKAKQRVHHVAWG